MNGCGTLRRYAAVPRYVALFTTCKYLESTFLSALGYTSGHTVFVWSCRMRADLPSIAYQAEKVVSSSVWPDVGSSIAYRLANLRVSRLSALLGASLFFYLA
jgi:hypothetical protein